MLLPNIVNERLKKIQNFRIFFGEPVKEMKDTLDKTKMLIVNPYLYSREQVIELQKSGVFLVGSINVLEMTYRSYLRNEDYYIENNERIYMLDTDAYIMNLSSSHYRYLLIHEMNEHIVKKGFNGILLIGEISEIWNDDEQEQLNQSRAFTSFIKQIRNRFKMMSIFTQWNTKDTIQFIQYIDGVVWEYFNYEQHEKNYSELQAIRQLNKIKHEKNIVVCTVNIELNRKNEEQAKKNGYLYYVETKKFKEW